MYSRKHREAMAHHAVWLAKDQFWFGVLALVFGLWGYSLLENGIQDAASGQESGATSYRFGFFFLLFAGGCFTAMFVSLAVRIALKDFQSAADANSAPQTMAPKARAPPANAWRNSGWIAAAIVIIVLAGVWGATVDQTSGPTNALRDDRDSYIVQYIVEGHEGEPAPVHVTYTMRGGTHEVDVQLPWKSSAFEAEHGQYVVLYAQEYTKYEMLWANITLDGNFWKTSFSTGDYTVAGVDGVVP